MSTHSFYNVRPICPHRAAGETGKDTFILLARHPFRITLSSDALVSKDTFFGRITSFQDLEVDIPSDKNHINQHRDIVLYMETYRNIEVKVGEIPDVTSQVRSQG